MSMEKQPSGGKERILARRLATKTLRDTSRRVVTSTLVSSDVDDYEDD